MKKSIRFKMNKMTIATSSANNGGFLVDYKLLYFYSLLCATLRIFILIIFFLLNVEQPEHTIL